MTHFSDFRTCPAQKNARALSRYIHYFQGGTMKKRNIWLAGTSLVRVIVVAGLLYTSHFASAVSQTQTHTAPGAVTATGTPIPSTGLSTFQIVPAQTTATYSVYENLIFQNKPNNDAVGTTHSLHANFRIQTTHSPPLAPITITFHFTPS